MTQTTNGVFMNRTRNIYRHQAERSEHNLDYDLADVRAWVTEAIASDGCAYCGKKLTVKTFSLDHAWPISRDGLYTADNIVICCRTCNLAKGNLTASEFEELLQLLDQWPEEVRNDVLGRLKYGGLAKRRRSD